MSYLSDAGVGTRRTPQTKKIINKKQIKNNAGGYVFEIKPMERVKRFLILGSEGGTYYVNEKKLTRDNALTVEQCIKTDGLKVVQLVCDISKGGRAPSNDPALFVLAMCSSLGDEKTRQAAFKALPEVARIGTHLFHFIEYRELFGGWGRGTRRAVANWYLQKKPDTLAYQLLKYQQRDGWSHRDLLRLAHPKADNELHNAMFKRTVGKDTPINTLPKIYEGIDAIASAGNDTKKITFLIHEYNLSREMIPTESLASVEIWEALLHKMPMGAMIRNLATMTRLGLLKPMGDATKNVCARLTDAAGLKKARIHPLKLLSALKTYESGKGIRGSHTWKPITKIIDALDEAFYLSFGNVEATGKRMLLALDVSSSMGWSNLAGVTGVTPAVGSAAMALITARVESDYEIMAFAGSLKSLNISPRMRLDDVLKKTQGVSFGSTDCSLPFNWARENKIDIDAFFVYTDNETWAGRSNHPSQALNEYREKRGIDAKSVVIGMTSTQCSIADPNDPGMLDICGFDTATPNVMSEFIVNGT